MAVQFVYALTKNKKHYGIYVRSISGLALNLIAERLPEVPTELIPAVYTDTVTKDIMIEKKGAIPVMSDRIERYKTETRAKQRVKELNSMADRIAVNKIWKTYIKPIEKHLVLLKAQYFQVYNGLKGEQKLQFTTQNKTLAETTALNYTNNNVPSKIVPTVSRTVIVSKKGYERIKDNIQEHAVKAGGAKRKLGEFSPNSRGITMKRKS